MAKTRTEDFGEKISGSKKELWKLRGLRSYDLESMNLFTASKYANKNNIWLKPNYDKMVLDDGYSREVVCFYKQVRDALPAKPKFVSLETDEKLIKEKIENYVKFIERMQELVTKNINVINDCVNFYKEIFSPEFVIKQNGRYAVIDSWCDEFVTNKLLKALNASEMTLKRDAEKLQIGYTEEEKLLSNYIILQMNLMCEWKESYYGLRLEQKIKGGFLYYYDKNVHSLDEANNIYPPNTWLIIDKKTRSILFKGYHSKEDAQKVALSIEKMKNEINKTSKIKKSKTDEKKQATKPPHLKDICRKGNPVRIHDIHAKGDDFLNVFHFRGGQFGNWVTEKERILNLDMAFDALADLSLLLQVDPKNIGLNGTLGIAFGARGEGNALAHFEPGEEVINLTRMKGAGSLGHEWIHALDRYLGLQMGYGLDLLSERTHYYYSKEYKKISDEYPTFCSMINTLRYKNVSKNEEPSYMTPSSKFYNDSVYFDGKKSEFSKPCEMLARAASAYLAQKAMKINMQNDYLLGHALCGSYKDPKTGETHYLYPVGEEMVRFGEAFENMIQELKDKNIFQSLEQSVVLNRNPALTPIFNYQSQVESYPIYESSSGQGRLNFGISFVHDRQALNDMAKYSQDEFLKIHNEYTKDDYLVTKEELVLQERGRE